MSDTLIVTSREPGVVLILRRQNSDDAIAELTHVGLSAGTRVASYRLGSDLSGGLGKYFADLATDWRGWVGERAWGSLEGELTLSAKCDRSGHVYVHVRLRQWSPGEWQVDAQLVLEAGQLARLAHDARVFEGSTLNIP